MNIPEQAVDAAIIAILEPGNPSNKHIRETSNYRQQMQAALEAALPHIEAALRTQIAADIRDLPTRPRPLRKDAQTATDYANDIEWAALTAEEGTTK